MFHAVSEPGILSYIIFMQVNIHTDTFQCPRKRKAPPCCDLPDTIVRLEWSLARRLLTEMLMLIQPILPPNNIIIPLFPPLLLAATASGLSATSGLRSVHNLKACPRFFIYFFHLRAYNIQYNNIDEKVLVFVWFKKYGIGESNMKLELFTE